MSELKLEMANNNNWPMNPFLLSPLLLLLTFSPHYTQSITHWQDIQALKTLKNALQSNSITPGSCISSWNFSLDPCDNLFSDEFTCGFRCDTLDLISGEYRITEIALDQAGYSGSISNIPWNYFPYLQYLDLSNNFFSGTIPDSLSNLTRLQRVTLSHNSLSGSPRISISSLEELYLDNNNLQGTIPPVFNGLKNLKRLEIQGNRLAGDFPDLSQLANLTFLDASDNLISGEIIPTNLPPSLIELSVRNNRLVGNIPVDFPVNLQVLDVSHNGLSGSVPSSLFTHPNLQQVTLSYNQLKSIQDPPGHSGRKSGLIAIDFSNNRIRGFLPAFMGLMPKLSALSMENNLLSGLIPTQYALKAVYPGNGLEPFKRLLLGGNYLFGPIPGPLMKVRDPGSVTVKLAGNCLYRCPVRLFFCEGGEQKSLMECKSFNPVIP